MASAIRPDDVAFTFLRDDTAPREETARSLWRVMLSQRGAREADLQSWRAVREDPESSTSYDLIRAMPVCGYMNVPDITEGVAQEIASRLALAGEVGVLDRTLAAGGDMRGLFDLDGDQIQAVVAHVEPLFYLRAVCVDFRRLTDDAMHAVLSRPLQHLRRPMRTFLSHARLWHVSISDNGDANEDCAGYFGLELAHLNCTICCPDLDHTATVPAGVDRVFRIDEWVREGVRGQLPDLRDGTVVPAPEWMFADGARDFLWTIYCCIPKPPVDDNYMSIRYLRDAATASADVEMLAFLRMATTRTPADGARATSLFPGELGTAVTNWLAQTAAPADLGNQDERGVARLVSVSNFVKYHAFCGYVRESEMGADIADKTYGEFLRAVCGGDEEKASCALDVILVLACLFRYESSLAEELPRDADDDRDVEDIYLERAMEDPLSAADDVGAAVVTSFTFYPHRAAKYWPATRALLFPEEGA